MDEEGLDHGLHVRTWDFQEELANLSDQMMEESEYESLPTQNFKVHLVAGGFAGVMEHCVMYPVDFVKTRMQSLRPNPNANYNNIGHALRTITKKEGGRTIIRGVNIVALGAGPAHSVYFASYEIARKALGNVRSSSGNNNPFANAFAGALATLCHDAAMNPVDVIKQRVQVYGSPYRGVIDCAKTVWRTEGISAFYRSYTTQVTMNIPFQSIHFVMYEFMREHLNPLHNYDPKTHLIAGGTAGAFAAAVTTPLDVAKTLLNTQERSAVNAIINQGHKDRFVTGMLDAVRTIHKLRGFQGYFQGLQARVVYQAPSCAICWSAYEFLKFWFIPSVAGE